MLLKIETVRQNLLPVSSLTKFRPNRNGPFFKLVSMLTGGTGTCLGLAFKIYPSYLLAKASSMGL